MLGCPDADQSPLTPAAPLPRPREGSRALVPCALCNEAFAGLDRRLCRCGSPVHQDCVEAHAKGCARASQLLESARQRWSPRIRRPRAASLIVIGFGLMLLWLASLTVAVALLDPSAGGAAWAFALLAGAFGGVLVLVGRTAG